MKSIKLSQRQRDILVQTALIADRPITELARRTGHHVHTVRHELERMRESGAIRKVWAVDCFRLGFFRLNVLFSLALTSPRQRETFLAELAGSPRTLYLGDIGGDFDFEAGILARSVTDAFQFLESLSKKYGDPFSQKSISLRDGLTVFPRKYLSTVAPVTEALSIGGPAKNTDLDDLDTEILCHLDSEPWQSLRQISQKADRPMTTIDARFRKLKANRVISGAVLTTNPSAYGAQGYIVLLFARGIQGLLADKLYQLARVHPHCTHFVRCLGDWDYELGLEVERHEQLVSFRDLLSQRFGPLLQHTKTLARFGVRKYSWYPLREKWKRAFLT